VLGIPFYNETIKQAVTVFGSLFNNIVIRRKDGTLVPVPISYGPRDKWLEAQKALEPDNEMFEKMLPRISYEVVAMNYDMQRKLTNKQQILGTNYGENQAVQRVSAPVPYNLDFSLYIQTKNLNDGWQIVEQILPFFTPAYTVRVRHYPQDYDSDTPIMQNEYDIPFVLNAVTWVDDWTGDIGDRRMVEWQLEFNTKIWMAGPTAADLHGRGCDTGRGKVILDSRAMLVNVPQTEGLTDLLRGDSDIMNYAADEVGYANIDGEPVVFTDPKEYSPDIINTIDSDGQIVKIIRNATDY